jgi:hypothetical protein
LYPRAYLVLRIVAAAVLALAALHLGQNGRLVVFGARASGRVVEIVSRRPVVEFETPAGRAVRFESGASFRRWTPYHPGDAVKVLYLPERPETAEIDDPRFLWLPAGMGLFFGGLLAAVCVIGRPRS